MMWFMDALKKNFNEKFVSLKFEFLVDFDAECSLYNCITVWTSS